MEDKKVKVVELNIKWLLVLITLIPTVLIIVLFSDLKEYISGVRFLYKVVIYMLLSAFLFKLFLDYTEWRKSFDKKKIVLYSKLVICYCIFLISVSFLFSWDYLILTCFKVLVIVLSVIDILLCLYTIIVNTDGPEKEI